jgi:hypothetical protein
MTVIVVSAKDYDETVVLCERAAIEGQAKGRPTRIMVCGDCEACRAIELVNTDHTNG